jgi:hypothetical protein
MRGVHQNGVSAENWPAFWGRKPSLPDDRLRRCSSALTFAMDFTKVPQNKGQPGKTFDAPVP